MMLKDTPDLKYLPSILKENKWTNEFCTWSQVIKDVYVGLAGQVILIYKIVYKYNANCLIQVKYICVLFWIGMLSWFYHSILFICICSPLIYTIFLWMVITVSY